MTIENTREVGADGLLVSRRARAAESSSLGEEGEPAARSINTPHVSSRRERRIQAPRCRGRAG
jgi:hypothetical protein